MVIDSSAVIAIILKENEASAMSRVIATAFKDGLYISSPSYVESYAVMFSRFGIQGGMLLFSLAEVLNLKIVDFTEEMTQLACRAYQQFSGGKHGLNMGDCFSYALAKARNEPLLCKGNDFKQTDIQLVQY